MLNNSGVFVNQHTLIDFFKKKTSGNRQQQNETDELMNKMSVTVG